MIQRPYRAYIEGYQDGIADSGVVSDFYKKRWKRAYAQGRRDGKTDREHIEAGRYFLPGQDRDR